VGLREAKKEHTRQQIAEAAMRLFVKRGFDRVTVADVADAAGVSEKTVFNYFPTKEDLFFDEVDEREAALVDAIRERAPGDSVTEVLHRAQSANCSRWATPHFRRFAQVVEESPALRAKELEVMARFEHTLACALREELGCDELDAEVAATLLIGVHWTFFVAARRRALAGEHGPRAEKRLRRDLDRAFALLEHGLADLGR